MLKEVLQYTFMQRALISGIFIALSSAGLGVFLVLRRYSMIGEGLGHSAFAAVAVGLLIGVTPMLAAIPILMLISLWILKLGERTAVYGETAIGLVASLAMAVGVLLASISDGFNIDLFSYLFGSILAITQLEVLLSILLSFVVISALLYFYHDLFAITYDEDFALVSGVHTTTINRILILLTSITVVLGIRVVGTLLISSLIIFPAVTALQISSGFKSTIFTACISAVTSVIIGIFSSFYLNLPTGAAIVVINFFLFSAAFIYSRITGKS